MLDEVQDAKRRWLAARQAADECAALYRKTVREAVASWQAGGMSLRACGDRLGLSEGALRDLLRAPGTTRRSRRQSTGKGTTS